MEQPEIHQGRTWANVHKQNPIRRERFNPFTFLSILDCFWKSKIQHPFHPTQTHHIYKYETVSKTTEGCERDDRTQR